jgi:hypothetical protein
MQQGRPVTRSMCALACLAPALARSRLEVNFWRMRAEPTVPPRHLGPAWSRSWLPMSLSAMAMHGFGLFGRRCCLGPLRLHVRGACVLNVGLVSLNELVVGTYNWPQTCAPCCKLVFVSGRALGLCCVLLRPLRLAVCIMIAVVICVKKHALQTR